MYGFATIQWCTLVSFLFAENLKFSFVSGFFFLMNDFDENGNDPFNVERKSIDIVGSVAVGHFVAFVEFPKRSLALSGGCRKAKIARSRENWIEINLSFEYMCIYQVKVMETAYIYTIDASNWFSNVKYVVHFVEEKMPHCAFRLYVARISTSVC